MRSESIGEGIETLQREKEDVSFGDRWSFRFVELIDTLQLHASGSDRQSWRWSSSDDDVTNCVSGDLGESDSHLYRSLEHTPDRS